MAIFDEFQFDPNSGCHKYRNTTGQEFHLTRFNWFRIGICSFIPSVHKRAAENFYSKAAEFTPRNRFLKLSRIVANS